MKFRSLSALGRHQSVFWFLSQRHLLSARFLVLFPFWLLFKVSLVFCSFIAMYLVVGFVLVCLFNPSQALMILKLKNSLSFINSKEFSSLLIPCLPHFIFLLLKLLLDVGSSCSVFHFPPSFIFSFILLFCILRISSYLTPS